MTIVFVNLPTLTLSSGTTIIPQALGLLSLASLISPPDHVYLISPIISSISFAKHPHAFYEKYAQKILSHTPDVIGMTTRCDSFYHTIQIATKIHTIAPHIPIILGGPHATVCDNEILTYFPAITAIIRGEAEIAFPKYLHALRYNTPFDEVPNLTFRKRTQIIKTPTDAPIKNLDVFPLPRYELMPKGCLNNPSLEIEAGRGCPYNCIFCSTSVFFHRYYRLKSPKRIMSELQAIHALYPSKKSFVFEHDNLTAHKQMFLNLCTLLQTKHLPFTWKCSSRIDIVNEQLLKTMKKAGCVSVYFGIETGSPRMQTYIRKNLNLDNVPSVFSICKKLQINTVASFIVGFPEETKEDVEQTLQLILTCLHHGASSVQLHLLSPLRGSSLYEQWKHQLYYSNHFFSDFTGGSTKNEQAMIKKYPTMFSAFYRFPTPHVSDYQLASVIAFGQAANILPHVLYQFITQGHVQSLYELCLTIAHVFKRKHIFQHTFLTPERQNLFFMHLWMKEFLTIIRTSSNAIELEELYNKDMLQYAQNSLSRK